MPIAQLPEFDRGAFQVQDEAAQLIAWLLDPAPGHRVLDACAGLGGKTGHIAQLMNNQGHVVAIDQSGRRLSRLKTEMTRLGISIAKTRQQDLTRPVDAKEHRSYDRVLLDAPCSGLGVIRRNPDAKWSVRASDLVECQRRQTRILDQLAPLVRTGGILVYAVCSSEAEENEAVAAGFGRRHPDYQRLSGSRPSGEGLRPFIDRRGYFRTFPHLHGTDGFFAVRFRRVK
jgi:16S rRNA (cytosine967-C5)-methyltransferase